MVQFRYAKTEKGEQVDIETLQQKQGQYYCIGCSTPMIPYLGKIRSHHFHHKVSCNKETYLHNLAKMEFSNIYNKCRETREPFYIEFRSKKICSYYKDIFDISCSRFWYRKINLLDYYTEPPALEEKEGEFIPDIKLFNKDKTKLLFIEIKVTHESTGKKKESKNHIIEIAINGENDIDCIRNKYISEKFDNIFFYNFIRNFPDNCRGNCKTEHYLLWLKNTGEVFMETKNLKQIKEIIAKREKEMVKKQVIEKGYKDRYKRYIKFVGECVEKGCFIKNCFMCKNAGLHLHWYPDDYYNPYGIKNWQILDKESQLLECSLESHSSYMDVYFHGSIYSAKKKIHCNYAVKCPDFTIDLEQIYSLGNF